MARLAEFVQILESLESPAIFVLTFSRTVKSWKTSDLFGSSLK